MTSNTPQEGTPAPARPVHSVLTTTDHSFLSSEPFEIMARFGKRFYVHSDILTAQSEPLRSTATGAWRESAERKIDLSDWDDDTVARFAEFLYSGSYRVPENVLLGGGDIEGGGGERHGWGNIPDTMQNPGSQGGPRIVDRNILVIHAKVYALAQYKDVQALKKMALERLNTVLGGIKEMSDGVARDIIELLVYVYSNTDSLKNSNEPLRDLVSTFVTENLETQMLMDHEKMGLLLREGGDFPAELIEKVAKRLCEMEKKLLGMGVQLAESCTRFEEVSGSLGITERELQSSRDHLIELHQKIRQLKSANVEGAKEVSRLKKVITDTKRILEHRRATKTQQVVVAEGRQPVTFISRWVFPLCKLFLVAAISAIAATKVTQTAQQASQLGTIDGDYFESICQYYEARSWTAAGSNFVVVGEKPLKEACEEYKPGSRVKQPSTIHGGTWPDFCHFHAARAWIGSSNWSVDGKPIKEVCISNYLTGRPSFGGKPLDKALCQHYKERSWIGSGTYVIEGRSLMQYCSDADFTGKRPSTDNPTSTKVPPSTKGIISNIWLGISVSRNSVYFTCSIIALSFLLIVLF